MMKTSTAFEELFASLRRGETRALARAVSLVEDRSHGANKLVEHCRSVLKGRARRAVRVGITGPAGAGKSTLVDALTKELRRLGRRVGIVAVDPSSPFSGGAILGDRIRLGEFAGDGGVYMRSMATRGHLGGLASATDDVLALIETSWSEAAAEAGRDVLLIETTGVGQGEIEVVRLADVVALVLVPGMGDSIQSLKAGVLEIASVYVLNKADREGTERLEQEINEMLGLSSAVAKGGKVPAVLRTIATSGTGVTAVLGAVDDLAGKRAEVDLAMDGGYRVPVLDHIGIAVRSIAEAGRLYAALGAPVRAIEEIMQEKVRVQMLQVGESRIELLEATEANSAVGRFLEKRGEGIHHVALRVTDLKQTVEKLQAEGLKLASETVQVGAGGHSYVFVHPSSANGVLLELVEDLSMGEWD